MYHDRMETTATTTRTFTAEGETFTTNAKGRYAVVITATNDVYCSDRDYSIPETNGGGVAIAKKTGNLDTAVKALKRYAKDLTRNGAKAGAFVSGSVVDTFTGETVADIA